MADAIYNVYLRDSSNQIIERLDVWSKLTLIKRFNRVGTWNLEIPTSSRLSRYVEPDTGIVVQRNGITIFSGPGGGDYEEDKNIIRASGTDDNVLLETPARPNPAQAVGPYTLEYDVSTGVASTIMRSLVDRNIGPSAPTSPVNWKIASLTLAADPLLGSVITARARFDPLIVLLAELASTPIATGLGFEILQSDSLANTLSFRVYEPEDRHLETVFSVELHTAQDYKHVHTTPTSNYFIVAGGDDFGLNRTVVEGGDATSIADVGRPVAAFVDRRGVTDLTELNQELAELIAGAVATDLVEIIPTDVPSLVFGDNYNLGDYVTAVVKGTEYAMLVREIEIDFDVTRGPIVTPTIADPSATNDEINSQHLDTLSHRISNIERNWNVPNDSIIEDMLHPTMKWYPGDVKITARSSAQLGWLLCDGSAISRTTYSRLFSAIGTLYGAGNGTTTFNIPSTLDKYVIGKGSNHALGTSAGTTTINISHSHPHSHGFDHTHDSQAHTHPGSHSHGLVEHTHTDNHTHNVSRTHDHGSITDGPSADIGIDVFTDDDAATKSHWHQIGDDNMNVSSGGSSDPDGSVGEAVPSGAFTSTQNDSNAYAASYSGGPHGSDPTSTESDNNSGGSAALAFDPPNVAMNYEIWTGLVP